MPRENNSWLRNVIFIAVFIPVLCWLMSFSMKKDSESESRAKQCSAECTASGNSGYEFKWNILSGPVCQCVP